MFEAKVKIIIGIDLKTIALEKQAIMLEDYREYTVKAVFDDIEKLLGRASCLIGKAHCMDYWRPM